MAADTKAASKAISQIISFISWGLAAFLVAKFFFPEFFSSYLFLNVFGGIFRWIYYIFSTITLILAVPSVIILFIFTYSDKLDGSSNINYNPNEKTKWWKSVIGYAKTATLIFFGAQLHFVAITIFASLALLLGLSIKVLEKDLTVKMTVLALNRQIKDDGSVQQSI